VFVSGVIEQAKMEIRFALNQLAARNGHYEFETLARMLARATVTRNILPATGPVSSGGDQGRDFETYRTELAGQTQRLGRRIGIRDRDGVGFACTLKQDGIGSKIRGDVDAIMAEGTPVRFVFAYCEVNIPARHRHDMQKQVMKSTAFTWKSLMAPLSRSCWRITRRSGSPWTICTFPTGYCRPRLTGRTGMKPI
jgi:hypothetical protein